MFKSNLKWVGLAFLLTFLAWTAWQLFGWPLELVIISSLLILVAAIDTQIPYPRSVEPQMPTPDHELLEVIATLEQRMRELQALVARVQQENAQLHRELEAKRVVVLDAVPVNPIRPVEF